MKRVFTFSLCLIFSSIIFSQAPQLTYPVNGGTMTITDAVKWNAVPGATSYEVTMSTNGAFTGIMDFPNITGTSLVPGYFLNSDQQYFWTARAYFGSTPSAWSDTFWFRTVTPGFLISPPILPEMNLKSASRTLTVADLTGSGKKEIIFLAQHRSSTARNLYRARKENNTWTIIDSFYLNVQSLNTGGPAPFPVDLDNDGDVDLVFNGTIFWNENGQFAKVSSLSTPPAFASFAVDQGNDGWFDIFSNGFKLNKGNRQFVASTTYMAGMVNGFADFNKDNRPDWVNSGGYIGYHDPKKDTLLQYSWTGDFIPGANSSYRSAAVGDIDGNGWIDLVTLQAVDASTNYTPSIHYFDSPGNPSTTIRLTLGVGQVNPLELADLNNDGRPDLLYADNSGINALMVMWNYSGSFGGYQPLFGRITATELVNPAVGDMDNDLDLDIVFADAQGYLRILENTATPSNTRPTAPTMLRAKFLADTVHFRWRPGTDAQQPSISLQNNLRVGTTRLGNQILSANADSVTGNRYTYTHPTASQDTTWMLKQIKPGKYFYSVQSVDNSDVGSVFSNVDSVFVCAPVAALLPVEKKRAADTSMIFKWTSALYAEGYQLQIAYDSLFSVKICDSLTTQTSLFIRNLPFDTLLYWRVRSYNPDGQSAWTMTRWFDTKRLSIELNWDITKPLCNTSRGMNVNVYYKGFWNRGNQFILELSDYLGSFVNARVLNTTNDSIPPDIIRFGIRGLPLLSGTNYKLRLRATQSPYMSFESPAFTIQNSSYTAFFNALPTTACFGANVQISFYELSYTSDSSHWYKNDKQINSLYYPSRSLTVNQPGYYRFDAYSTGCMAVDSITYFGTDCYKVWPGDANSDTRVNELDLFTIGRNNNKTGPPRTDPGNEWRAHIATNWSGLQDNYFNLKHGDCNGDGIIAVDDTSAISANYGMTHPLGRMLQLADSLRETLDPIAIHFDQPVYHPNDLVKGSVIVGTPTSQIMLSGLSFNIEIADSLISPGTFKIYADSMGLFYRLGPHYSIFKNDEWIIHTANGKHVEGYGSVARFSFVLKSVADATPIQATAKNVVMTNLHGSLWTTIQSQAGIANSSNIVTAVSNPPIPDSFIVVLPNPVTGKNFYIKAKLPEPLNVTIQLYNYQGQQIGTRNERWNGGDNIFDFNLPVSSTPGIYFIRVTTKKWATTRKLIIL